MFQPNIAYIRKTYGQCRLGLGPLTGRMKKCRQLLATACTISRSRPCSSILNRHSLCSLNTAHQSELSITTQTMYKSHSLHVITGRMITQSFS